MTKIGLDDLASVIEKDLTTYAKDTTDLKGTRKRRFMCFITVMRHGLPLGLKPNQVLISMR